MSNQFRHSRVLRAIGLHIPVLTLRILMGSSISYDTIHLGWFIVYIEGSSVIISNTNVFFSLFVCLFVLLLYVPSQQLWSLRAVSSPNHTFSWAGLNKRLTSNLCTYFRL